MRVLIASVFAAAAAPGAVQKVVTMLQDMKSETEAEAKRDQESYEKMQCWCSTNKADKTKSIKDGDASIADLTSTIEQDAATIAKLEVEIEELTRERKANQDMLAQATEMRAKQNGEYEATHQETLGAVSQLDGAIKTLSSNFGADGSTLMQVANVVRRTSRKFQSALEKDYASVVDSLNLDDDESQVQAQGDVLGALATERFLQPVALDQQKAPAGYKSYNAASGKILGILKQMKEGMETDDAGATGIEKSQQKAFDELKTAKDGEIAAETNQIDDKTSTLADTKVHKDQASQDLEETTATREADAQFLADVEGDCATADKEYSARSTERSEELSAIAATIGILTSDEARALFSSSIGGFVEVSESSRMMRARRSKASSVLRQAFAKSHGTALLSLAVSVKLDGFTKVKKAMDDMVVELKQQQVDDDTKKEHCGAEMNQNDLDAQTAGYKKEDLERKAADLEITIDDLTTAIADLNKNIDETQTSVKRAGEDRATENRNYQQTVAEQRATIKILNFALKKLQGFYGTALLAKSAAPGERPEAAPEQATYERKGQSGGVMHMISMIVEDTQRMEKETISDEGEAQANYEKLLNDSFDAMARMRRSITDKSEVLAESKAELGRTKTDLKDTNAELEDLQATRMELHAACDYLIANYDPRLKARADEIDSINHAKAVLSGA
mmetsp:Transcript_18648/g.41346  ORF Transcript_18648/g.41346 Transcript_18648/m.41346 type:complete len:679 (-) Transcript_18648:72-2108(-)